MKYRFYIKASEHQFYDPGKILLKARNFFEINFETDEKAKERMARLIGAEETVAETDYSGRQQNTAVFYRH